MGPAISTIGDRQKIVNNNARRLEVLRNCVNFIFDNKISDARIVSFKIVVSTYFKYFLTAELAFLNYFRYKMNELTISDIF
jgi:hypothetical protein